MEKEEILARSREELKNQDMEELEVLRQASGIALKAGILVCCLVSAAEVIAAGRPNYACWTIYFGMLTALFFVKYRKLRRRHELLLTVFFLLCFILMAVCHLYHLFGG